VINRLGLHARAAAKLVHLASSFASDVQLVFEDGEEIDGKSILGILAAERRREPSSRCAARRRRGRRAGRDLAAVRGPLRRRGVREP